MAIYFQNILDLDKICKIDFYELKMLFYLYGKNSVIINEYFDTLKNNPNMN